MRQLNLLILLTALVAVACNAQTSGKPVEAAAAPKPEDPDLVEHRRIMAEQAKFQARFLAALPKMQVQHLYYIDPMASRDSVPAKDLIQGYVALSHAKVSGPLSAAGTLQGSLRRIIESAPEYAAACFDPHHVVVLSDGKEQFDAVTCFDCGNYRIFSPNGDWLLAGSFDVGEESTWDKVFSAAGLKRPPHDADH